MKDKDESKDEFKDGFKDDGRVIADMNFDGAPWQTKGKKNMEPGLDQEGLQLTKKETFQLMKTALFAGLIIGLIFVVAFLIFILFSTKIWLR